MDGRKPGKSLNMVHNDEIWKDHIHRELLSQKHWPQKWGFLSEIYEELRPEKPKDSTATATQSKPTTSTTAAPITSQSNFPTTNSKMIGWRLTNATSNSYGIREGVARGKCDILRTFNWPQESQ